MNIAAITDTDASILIGRDPRGVAEEYAVDDDASILLTAAEYRGIGAMIQARAIALPATRSRQIAIEIIPAVASMCRTLEAVDLLLAMTCNWIKAMGNIRHHAAAVMELRAMGEECEEARIVVPIDFNADAVFDIQDAQTISVVLEVHRRDPVMVGMHTIDDSDGERNATPAPALSA